MLQNPAALRDSLRVARLVREELLAAPLRPPDAAALRRAVTAANAVPPVTEAALRCAASAAAADDAPGDVTRRHLDTLAAACGDARLRAGPGEPFHGQAAPPPARVGVLLDEILETVNAPRVAEAWDPVARAFVLHFLLRLVQPFAAPPAAVGAAAEALLLAAEGFAPDLVRLPPPGVVGEGREGREGRPDPDAFALARLDALVEGLAQTRERVREWESRAVLLGWVEERDSGWNPRQRRLLLWLATPGRSLSFPEYAALHAGRRAPSLRSLQRDWKSLREAGFLEPVDAERWRLSCRPLEYGR